MTTHPVTPEVQQEFDNFWKPIVCDNKGFFNPDAVKNELFDFSCLIKNASVVYDYATGGMISNVTVDASVINGTINNHIEEIVLSNMQDLYDIAKTAKSQDEIIEFIENNYNVE